MVLQAVSKGNSAQLVPGASNTGGSPKSHKMAVFRKMLSSAKGRVKVPSLKIKSDRGGSTSRPHGNSAAAEEFERKKQEWQDELEQMSDFLFIKSTSEQQDEGVTDPVDTAFIQDKDGMPFLKAVFDVKVFSREDINIRVDEENSLIVEASNREERGERIYTRTFLRKIDIPKFVDHKMMHCDLNPDGLLTIEMPFHLPPQRKPQGPNVFPILQDGDGRRKLRLCMPIGREFTSDDVQVTLNGRSIRVLAEYHEDIGKYRIEVMANKYDREYELPDGLEIEEVQHTLAPDGRLFVELFLKPDLAYKCFLSAEEVDDI